MRNPLLHTGLEGGYPLLLRGRWKQRSQQAGWRYPGDWLVPEVEGVIQARMAGNTLEAAAKQLGASRAYQGVGVRETMLDLSAFFAAAEVPTDDTTMRGLVEGWAAQNERPESFSCTDARTGLPTMAHFERLLYDLSLDTEAQRKKMTIATLHLEWADRGRALTWGQLADIGDIMLWGLASLHATATVHGTRIHVLMKRSKENYAALKRCIDRLDRLAGASAGKAIASFASLPSWPGDQTWAPGQLESNAHSITPLWEQRT